MTPAATTNGHDVNSATIVNGNTSTKMPSHNNLSVQSLFSVQGWVCVVTGGGTGLGFMTSNALAANGAKVYITGRRREVLEKAEMQHPSGGSIIALPMDITDKATIRKGVDFISQREKCVNLLVNNAGVSGDLNYGPSGMPTGSIESISAAMFDNQEISNWTQMYAINVASYYFVSAAFLSLLVAARSHGFSEAGNIINVSSMSGITKTSQNGQFAYNSSKAACISLTEQLATDFKRPGVEVRVNTIAPGYFPSEMTVIDGASKEELIGKWGIPAGRAGTARDYSQAVIGLAVNNYVTGSTLLM
jgi:NAD(P)-dependent dehydrogenase (short-subunit alcohol dehydrogenase family)